MAHIFYFFKNRKTAAKGLETELLAQARFANDPNLVVFTPTGSKGPIDLLVLNLTTGEYKAYDVKTRNFRKKRIKDTSSKNKGAKSSLGVKILNFDPQKY